MASWHPTELLLICAIALIILGPKRLPEIASKVGGLVGKARRMTRILKRQLEEELDIEKGLNIRPKIKAYVPPSDDDTFSPLHSPAPGVKVDAETEAPAAETETPPTEAEPEPTADGTAAADDDGERRDS